MPTRKYGFDFPDSWGDADIEKWCFLNCDKIPDSPGRFHHFRECCKVWWPEHIWHPWNIERLKEVLDPKNCYAIGDIRIWNQAWVGAAASGKTTDSALLACAWWKMMPEDSIVICCSTTKRMVRRRVWPEIMKLIHSYKGEDDFGHVLDSQSTINALSEDAKKGDFRHSIHCIAVAGGELEKAISDIQGQHAGRILVIIDEASATPPAIYGTIANLRKGCRELIILSIGNPVTKRIDPLGIICEPEIGWRNVTRFTHKWKTRRNKEWEIPGGICLHFPGRDSPNVKAQKTIYPFLYSWEDYLSSQENSDERTIQFWKFTEGFWCPDGSVNTLFTETLIEAHDGQGTLPFINSPTPISGCDPAFEGDNFIQVFGLMGELENKRIGIQITERKLLQAAAMSKESKELQFAKMVIEGCEQRQVRPDCLGLDCTGNGRGVHAYIYDMWSELVVGIQFGGGPSDDQASIADNRPAKEVYDRRVTELWFNMLEFLKGDQLKGLYPEAILQLCTREYGYKERKLSLMIKREMKTKLGYSPDDGDALAVMFAVARRLGAVPAGMVQAVHSTNWIDAVRKFNVVYLPQEQTVDA